MDQKTCGSCWAIATTTAVNDHLSIRGLKLELSVPFTMDCNSDDPCDGGSVALLLKKLSSGETYLVDSSCAPSACSCTRDGAHTTVHVEGVRLYDHDSADEIRRHIAAHGPVIGGMKVYENFKHGRFGTHGIYLDSVSSYDSTGRPVFGGPGKLLGAHAVVVVGFGRADHVETSPTRYESVDYWICRNSWGTGWGDGGFFKIATYPHNESVMLERIADDERYGRIGGILAFTVGTGRLVTATRRFGIPPLLQAVIGIAVALVAAAAVAYVYRRRRPYLSFGNPFEL